MSNTWPEITAAKSDQRHELLLSGEAVSKRIREHGLDPSLFDLTSLNYLSLTDTCLDGIPDAIHNLSNLQTLVLHSNKIETVSRRLNELTKLKVLDLSKNLLQEFISDISGLTQLSSLNLSLNKLETCPCLEKNTKLSVLDLSNNKLMEFPDICHAELSHLLEVRLNGNCIGAIPAGVSVLPALKLLDLSANKITAVPGELADASKLKDINLKENPISDKRLGKMIAQCHTKQVLDYIKQHCPKSSSDTVAKSGKKSKKGKKDDARNEEATEMLTHKMSVLYVSDDTPSVQITEDVKSIRPHIVCCIVKNMSFTEESFKKFIQLQTKLHDTVCEKRNAATIATHDLQKLGPGNLIYAAKKPSDIEIMPLSRNRKYTAHQLYSHLKIEAENLRKEKKRNVYSGIHKYLYLLEGKPLYTCLIDSRDQVVSFPPITNSEYSKMSTDTKSMLVEVTSSSSQGVCRKVLDALLREILLLGVGGKATPETPDISITDGFHSLTVQQVKIIDGEGNMKSVYPSRTDLVYEGENNITIVRE